MRQQETLAMKKHAYNLDHYAYSCTKFESKSYMDRDKTSETSKF